MLTRRGPATSDPPLEFLFRIPRYEWEGGEEEKRRRGGEEGRVEKLMRGMRHMRKRRKECRGEGERQAGRRRGGNVILVCWGGTFNSITMSQKVSRSISGLPLTDALVR